MRKFYLPLLLLPACFPSEGTRRYPTWERTTRGTQVLADCADVDAWASKSGKEGLGVTLELRGRSTTPCVVTITAARLRVGVEEYLAKQLPEPPTVRLGQRVNAYLAFAFDGDRAWNDGAAGALVITAATTTVTFNLQQTMPSRAECETR